MKKLCLAPVGIDRPEISRILSSLETNLLIDKILCANNQENIRIVPQYPLLIIANANDDFKELLKKVLDLRRAKKGKAGILFLRTLSCFSEKELATLWKKHIVWYGFDPKNFNARSLAFMASLAMKMIGIEMPTTK